MEEISPVGGPTLAAFGAAALSRCVEIHLDAGDIASEAEAF
jgi:hypothetical protein